MTTQAKVDKHPIIGLLAGEPFKVIEPTKDECYDPIRQRLSLHFNSPIRNGGTAWGSISGDPRRVDDTERDA